MFFLLLLGIARFCTFIQTTFQIKHMNQLVIVIIDDEPKNREILKAYIHRLFPNNSFEIILCNSVKTGVEAIENYLPDLVFLDIEMPEANGFELFAKVNKETFEVVFTTAYAQYMERSINEIGCFGYLLKPIDGEKLKTIFDRYQQKVIHKKYFKFFNHSKNKRMMILLEDILYCKADSNYCTIHLENQKIVLSKTLGETEKILPAHVFTRVHRSYIINKYHIEYFDKEKNSLVLKKESDEGVLCIPVSQSQKDKIETMFA